MKTAETNGVKSVTPHWKILQSLQCHRKSSLLLTAVTTTHVTLALTDCVVPAVDGEQAAARDGNGCWYAEVGERVGGDMGDGRVGGELEHHDDVLLHLILKHQGTLGKETLVRQTEKERRRG